MGLSGRSDGQARLSLMAVLAQSTSQRARGNRHPGKDQPSRNQKPNKDMPRPLRRQTKLSQPLIRCQVKPEPPEYDPSNCEQYQRHR